MTRCERSIVRPGAVLLACLGLTGPVAAGRWFVDADAIGGADDGSSWADAFRRLDDALDAAGPGDEIWVADGTYVPGRGSLDRRSTFLLPDGVALYGGFAGTETSRGERDPEGRPTVLSGDLRGDDGGGFRHDGDNALNVVRIEHVGPGTVLDGFVLAGGNANGRLHERHEDNGGGIHVHEADPGIRGCTIIGNSARSHGGGISVTFSSAPIVENCLLIGNRVTGGLSSDGGGGMYVYSFSTPVIRDSRFVANSADGSGGGLQSVFRNDVLVERCRFEGNEAWFGGGIETSDAHLVLLDSVLDDNDALFGGGGIRADFIFHPGETFVDLVGTTIEDNRVDGAGGQGGGLLSNCATTIVRSVIRGNSAESEGGGIFYGSFLDGIPVVRGLEVSGNRARRGGGIYCRYLSTLEFDDILVADNIATEIGGGLGAFDDADVTIRGGTFAGNEAPLGPGVSMAPQATDWSGRISIANSILHHPGRPEIENRNESTIEVIWSNVDGGWPGEGNVDVEPGFQDPARGDYHLRADSPCRDAGHDALVRTMTDFEGDARPADGATDLGADEFGPRLYLLGRFEAGAETEFRVIGEPGSAARIALGERLLAQPVETAFGPLWIPYPAAREVGAGPTDAGGLARLPLRIPNEFAPEGRWPFQAAAGVRLTNPLVLEAPSAGGE